MKKALFLFLSIIMFQFSCQSVEKKGDFKLLPQPQHITIKGNSSLKYNQILYYYSKSGVALPIHNGILENIKTVSAPEDAQIIYSIDKNLDVKQEGYTLEISNNQIQITGKDNAGLLYAFQTLGQLMEDAKEQDVFLPTCFIKDFPLLSYRAIHLDIKHHIDKLDFYYKLFDKLAKYKINAVIVEMEDKLKYKRQPVVASGDALSIETWQKLSDYAIERNIEISPLIQGLGHASFILKHNIYKELRDDPQSDWAFNPLNPKTYKVQFDLYLDAIEATPHGRFLHIGGDEVHTTGRNSGKSPLELQLLWLNKVCKFAEEHDRTPIFWDDMPLKFAGVYNAMFNKKLSIKEVDEIWRKKEPKLLKFLDQFPKNCIYMRWNYSSPQAVGNSKAMDWFRSHNLQVMGATAGQTTWVLMPQNESNMENIKAFALSSQKSGLNGLLLTLWDDESPHFTLYTRGILSFAEYTWSGKKRNKEEIKAAYRQREFSHKLSSAEYAFIDKLEKPVAFWKNALLKGNKRNHLKKMKDPVSEALIALPDKNGGGGWTKTNQDRLQKAKEAAAICDTVAEQIKTMKNLTARNNYTLDVYEQVNNMVRFSCDALLNLEAYDTAQNEKQKTEAFKRIKQLPDEFEKLRQNLDEVYAVTRNLDKPADYLLDQDHHSHLANQAILFNDWQFYAEKLFLRKLKEKYDF